ncbi:MULTISPECIES: hypothetical protein [Micrococcaceae]|uniref:hypothetical protein n=1 Tax=Micrococcaceae TaxID=1268 RepID=UPI0013EF964D|nr:MULTISPECIES: hypothetical protein [Micrococcaceae]UXN31501.1 hypothetical protein N6V40_14270 [Glutamicibacter sp. M10]
MLPHNSQPAPGPHGVNDSQVEQVLSSLADHDITEHAGIYEHLLNGLQQELNRTEQGR